MPVDRFGDSAFSVGLRAPFGKVFLDLTLMIAASRTHLVRSSQCFQRHVPVELRIPCSIHLTHAAFTDLDL